MSPVFIALLFATAWGPPDQGAPTGLFVDGELFTDVDVEDAAAQPSAPFSQFALDRLALGGGASWERFLSVYGQLETIRSAAPLSAFGIDKDSLVPRVRLAYGQLTPRTAVLDVPLVLTARFGLIPDPWLEALESRLGARGLASLPSESASLLVPSDLGASASLDVDDGTVRATVAVTNGEGLNEVERNAGKDITAVVVVAHSIFDLAGTPMVAGAQAMYRDGSTGVAPVRDNRAGVAVFLDHDLVHVVGEGVLGLGFASRANEMPLVLGARIDAQMLPSWLGAVSTYDLAVGDLSAKGAYTQRASLGVFTDFGLGATQSKQDQSRLLRRARLYAIGDASFGGPTAGPAPGIAAAGNLYGGRVVLEIGVGTGVIDPVLNPDQKATP